MSQSKATSIALAKFGGKVVEVELDNDDGKKHYEIEIITDKEEIDVDVDAYTGAITSVERETLDQDDDRDDDDDDDDERDDD
ncbi:hypothetical protein N784_13760 [Pontibacillus litoralis JSM 072002]|uniref:PepSY domain-containing protein n=1 Tax=Pontibacillus litoralis JSM 072002 TaxID=1385512 RepID=A0A0A5HVK9_9BACI|nr:hypothetical protein N784_13760 [Pontibacillus litoralis JSM 072002]